MTDTNPPGGQTGSPSMAVQSTISLLDQAQAVLESVNHHLGGHREPALEQIAFARGRLQEALKQFNEEAATA